MAVSTPASLSKAEYAVKARYLYQFVPFVQWPADAFDAATDPITICLAGHDPFGQALRDAVRGRQVNGRAIAVRHVDAIRGDARCHLLFAGVGRETPELLQALARQPILTVSDRNRGVPGGIIQFVMVGGRVRFVVDQGAARASGMAISSKLLELAVSVSR